MKKTIALLMIVFLPQAHAHLEEFVRSPDGEMAHYYDATKVVRDRGQTTFRLPIKVEYQSPVVALNGGLVVSSGLMDYEFDCVNKKVRVLSIEGFTMPNLKGKLSLTSSELPDWRRGHLNRWTFYEDEPHYKPVVSLFCS